MPDLDASFAPSYPEARQRFRQAAVSAGAELDTLPLACRGPDGDGLSIDIAWLGGRRPRHAVIHVSGVHGVEGFAGSAIQRRVLEDRPPVDSANAVILVHVLNPFGMAWLRRVNEHNVDLNRNWIVPGVARPGMPPLYRQLSRFLNPTAIRGLDTFYPRALFYALRYGMGRLKHAIASGQYADPRGLFYGGRRLEEGPVRFKEWLQDHLASVRRLAVIDVHTGLGPWCQNSLFYTLQAVDRRAIPEHIGENVSLDFATSDVGGYDVTGGHVEVYRQLFPATALSFVTQELGTYSGFRVLKALRAENCHQQYGGGDPAHPAKSALKEVFAPASHAWRAAAVDAGLRLFHATHRVTKG